MARVAQATESFAADSRISCQHESKVEDLLPASFWTWSFLAEGETRIFAAGCRHCPFRRLQFVQVANKLASLSLGLRLYWLVGLSWSSSLVHFHLQSLGLLIIKVFYANPYIFRFMPRVPPRPVYLPSTDDVTKAAAVLSRSDKPLVIIGQGKGRILELGW